MLKSLLDKSAAAIEIVEYFVPEVGSTNPAPSSYLVLNTELLRPAPNVVPKFDLVVSFGVLPFIVDLDLFWSVKKIL